MLFNQGLRTVLGLVAVFTGVLGCSDHEDGAHDHSKRGHSHGPAPVQSVTPPSRALEWGDINIIHTTDSHGWLLGHQKKSFPEPNYRYAPTFEFGLGVLTMWFQWRSRRLCFLRCSYEGDRTGMSSLVVRLRHTLRVRIGKRCGSLAC